MPRKLAAHRSRPPGWLIVLLVVIGLMLVLVGAMWPCTSEAGQHTCCVVGGILLVAAAAWAFGDRAICDAVKALRS